MGECVDDSLVLLEILDVLGCVRGCVSYAEECVYLSGRFALQPLLELRSLLFSTACRDPCFPATLFRDRIHPPCSSSLSAAADVVSLFNLLTHTRPPSSHSSQTLLSCLAGHEGCKRCDWPLALSVTGGGARAQDCKYERFRKKPVSLSADPTHTHTLSHTLAHPPIPHCDSMQNTDQHSVDTPIDSTANQDSESVDHVTQHSCVQKRNVFKEEFHNLIPLVPKDTNDQSEQSGGARQRDEEDETLFITHRNPYPDTAAHTHSPATHTQNHPAHRHTPADTHTPSRRTKHESLDDLQSSTYFGPTVTDWTHVSQTPPTKSHSLDIDNRLERSGLERSELGKSAFGGVERSGLHGSGLEGPGLQGSGLEGPGLQGSGLESSGLESSGLLGGLERFGLEGSGLEGPGFNLLGIGVDMRDVLKHLSGRSLTGLSDWMLNIEDVVSVGTQTDLPDRKHLRSLMLGDKLSLDNPDIAEDDISAIFRFLDDISMCGSMAVLPNSGGEVGGGSGGQAGATSPDRQGRLGKLRRLFHSLEAPEEGLRSGLCRLLLRVAELEQRLEPLAELREQLAQVLATLHRLEQRGQQTSVPQQAAPGANAGLEWSDRGRGASGKRNGLFTRRASKAHTESSSSEQHREWSISYSKEQHTHTAQTEEEVIRPHLLPETHQAPPRSCTMSTDQRLTSWSQSELTPLDLQAPESLEFWMEEIYTPGSDTLLRRTHTHTPCTRAKAYRITALGVTAVAILILIIVIPICTA